MGFGFNLLFVFVVFPIGCLVLVIFLFYGKWKLVLKIIASLFAVMFIIGGVIGLIRYLHSPIQLTHDDIIGKYEIDTLLYPGKDSQWQYKTYSFEMTDKDSLILRVNAANKQQRIHRVKFDQIGTTARDTLHILIDTNRYHLFKQTPLLVRGHNRFYYVFGSDYGNMFFRKKAGN